MVIEAAGALLLGIAFTAWAQSDGHGAELAKRLQGHRADIYSTAASLAGSLLGFVITAFAITVAAVGSPRLKVVRDAEQVPMLVRIFLVTTVWLGAATIIGLIGLLTDTDSSPEPRVLYLLATVMLLCFVTLARLRVGSPQRGLNHQRPFEGAYSRRMTSVATAEDSVAAVRGHLIADPRHERVIVSRIPEVRVW